MDQPGDILVRKASGTVVRFEEEKLRRSLIRSGADDAIVERILRDIYPRLHSGIATSRIYSMAHKMLAKLARPVAARYHLKRAIMELGPTGFPFEIFVSGLLRAEGYEVSTGVFVDGKCVRHEIDVVAMKDNHHFMIECKYHNQQGIFCDVKVPLYIEARFRDVEAKWREIPGHSEKFHQGWVVTNTRFSRDAMTYGACAGLYLLGWDHPRKEGLRERIDRLGLYPLTCLSSLTRQEKRLLLDNQIVMVMEICENPFHLERIGVPTERREMVVSEGKKLCEKPLYAS